jgi:hypothetical protein
MQLAPNWNTRHYLAVFAKRQYSTRRTSGSTHLACEAGTPIVTAMAPRSAELFTVVKPDRDMETTSCASPAGAGHAPAEHGWDRFSAGHAAPPHAGSAVMVRLAVWAPSPHVTPHADQPDRHGDGTMYCANPHTRASVEEREQRYCYLARNA